MHIDFTGKVAAVTGTSGIGLDAGLHLARLGARVFLAGIDAELNRAAAEMAAGEGLAVTVQHVDVADEASVRAWSAEIAGETGHLHALVNAAAIQFYGSIEDTTPEMWDRTYRGQSAVMLPDIALSLPADEGRERRVDCAYFLGAGTCQPEPCRRLCRDQGRGSRADPRHGG
jgi:NADP-dependent 3-hydroxy acid dehydrogenase YdfG